MNKKTTSGISLVALIVTIIVLIILTAAVIVTFMEGGIIERAKEAVFKSDIRTYQEILLVKKGEEQIKIATGNGGESELNATELADIQKIIPEFKEEYKDLIEISNGEIILGSRSENPYTDWLAELGILTELKKEEAPVIHNETIPEGGIYYVKDSENYECLLGDYSTATETLIGGNSFPTTLNYGDVYVYGDYEYRYGYSFSLSGEAWMAQYSKGNPDLDTSIPLSWGIRVLDSSKTEYEPAISEINNRPVAYLDSTYRDCSNLLKAPLIPNTAINLNYTFTNCTSLIEAPIIPENVTTLHETFYGCISLVSAPVIHENITSAPCLFMGCTSLTGEVIINATNMNEEINMFLNTKKPITLTGSSTILETIAEKYDNVTVAQ